ncbi:hypothetical protein B0H10DRAFT_2248190 [Mycena sp. CBHHK59/15]|nr:hypothetical protein B0H10DRAFT_2248190 [Mycena sp. CBHHK59/15]
MHTVHHQVESDLSKCEARLVKNRAAAFRSRQRKREELQLMKAYVAFTSLTRTQAPGSRVAELEQESAELRYSMCCASPDSRAALVCEIELLRAQLQATEELKTAAFKGHKAIGLPCNTKLSEVSLPLGGHQPALPSLLDNQPYGDGTIDPSLLGGGDEDMRMNSPTPSRTSSSPSSSSSEDSTPPLATGVWRKPVQRHVPQDMVRTDTLESDDGYSSNSSSGYISDIELSPTKPIPKSKPKQAPVKDRTVKGGLTAINDTVDPSALSSDKYDPGTVPFERNASAEDWLQCKGVCS